MPDWCVISGVGGHIPQLGEQHTLLGSVSEDEARGRIDEWNDPSLRHEETDF